MHTITTFGLYIRNKGIKNVRTGSMNTINYIFPNRKYLNLT